MTLTSLLPVMCVSLLSPQETSRQPFAPAFVEDRWSSEDGLPQDAITDLLETSDGYLWLGTFGGLARFDGVRFQVYTLANTPGFTDNRILSLFEDSEGTLWIGTQTSGVMRYRDGVFAQETETSDQIWDIAEDESGTVWLAGDTAVWRKQVDESSFSRISRTYSSDILCDSHGRVLVATKDGVMEARGETLVPATDLHADTPPRRLAEDRDGLVWVISGNEVGTLQGDGSYSRRYDLDVGYPYAVLFDERGRLWIGGGRGLVVGGSHADESFYELAPFELEALDGGVRSLLAGPYGTLWIGADVHGLVRIRPAAFAEVAGKAGLPEGPVHGILAHPEGLLTWSNFQWARVWNGSRFRDPDEDLPVLREVLTKQNLLGIAEGALWARTQTGLVKTEITPPFAETPVDGPAWLGGLLRDSTGTLWFGTQGGLARLQGEELELVPVEGVGVQRVRLQAADTEGGLWFIGSGLVGRYLDGESRIWDRTDGIPANEIRDAYIDSKDRAWISTYGGGLVLIADDRLTTFGPEQGLVDSSLGGILEDDHERLWINSNRGVLVLGKTQLEAVARGEARRVSCRRLRSPEGNGADAHEDSHGLMWFPTVAGPIVADPGEFVVNAIPPKVAIEEVRREGRPVDRRSPVRFPAGAGHVEIDYTGISPRDPEHVSFRYRLEGFEEDWNDAGSRRTAYYNSVPPGTYSFHVIASNEDGIWNPDGARLEVEFLPHFWETVPFIAVTISIGAAGILALHRRRVSGIRRHAAELQLEIDRRELAEAERKRLERSLLESSKLEAIGRLAGGISHDFNNVLTAILCRTELMGDHIAQLEEGDLRRALSSHKESISDCSQRAAALTQQLLAFSRQQVLRPEVLDPNSVITGIQPMLEQLLPENIEFIWVPGEVPLVRVDRTQLEQVVMNLVLNGRDAIEDGGRILVETLDVHLDTDHVRQHTLAGTGPHVLVAVTDTGSGIEESSLPHVFEPFFTTKSVGEGSGLGLATVYGIVKQSKGHVTVYSERGVGTVFKVYLPAADSEKEAAPEQLESSVDTAASGTELVLVCEDDPEIRAMICLALDGKGYRVLETSSPSEALRTATGEAAIDLILTDVVLPEKSGHELARELLESHPRAKVLYVSGYTSNMLQEWSEHELRGELLDKPFTPAQLLAEVRRVLDEPVDLPVVESGTT